MKRIYDDASDKYVNSVVLYPDTNAVLHYGAEPKTTDTDTVAAADLEELFLKNFVVIDAGDSGLIRPSIFPAALPLQQLISPLLLALNRKIQNGEILWKSRVCRFYGNRS